MVDLAGDLERVRVRCEGRVVAEHPHVWARGNTITDPVHVQTAAWLRKQFQQPRAPDHRGRRRRWISSWGRRGPIRGKSGVQVWPSSGLRRWPSARSELGDPPRPTARRPRRARDPGPGERLDHLIRGEIRRVGPAREVWIAAEGHHLKPYLHRIRHP